MHVALIVPIKSFATAKGRLDEVLTAVQRETLARSCAHRTVTALNDSAKGAQESQLSIIVACEDEDVQIWCREQGLSFIVPLQPGLDAAAISGVNEAIRRGADFLIVAHADLAHPEELAELVHERCDEVITLVPDLDFNGTNVIALPVRAMEFGFEFMYGPGSFARHAHIAEQVATDSDLMLHVLDDSLLSIDIDTPEDLDIPGVRALVERVIGVKP